MEKPSTGIVEKRMRSGRTDTAAISPTLRPEHLPSTVPDSMVRRAMSPPTALMTPSKRFVSPMNVATNRLAGSS